MKKISAAFGSLPMTWPIVCGFAVIIGIYVGVINQIPILQDTSFQDIAVTLEWWVLFAVLIVSNCKSAREAGLKCLVFFLISQPVIYLVELPAIGLDKALYYYTSNLAARFAADPPRWSNRVPCKAPECFGRSDTGRRKYDSCPDGSKLFSANAQSVSTAFADGGIMRGDRCRNGSRNAKKTADAAFVGGDYRFADGRDRGMDGAERQNSLKLHCALNFWCIARKRML